MLSVISVLYTNIWFYYIYIYIYIYMYVCVCIYIYTSSNARLRPGGGDNTRVIVQSHKLLICRHCLLLMTDRQYRQTHKQTDTQTDRQVTFIGRDYSRKYLKMRLMVGEAEGV